MVRARAQVDEIRRTGMAVADDFRAASAEFSALLEDASFREADVVFDRELTLDLGAVMVSLTAMGTNHTEGDTIALVVEDRVLFSGDIAMTRAPAFASPGRALRVGCTPETPSKARCPPYRPEPRTHRREGHGSGLRAPPHPYQRPSRRTEARGSP